MRAPWTIGRVVAVVFSLLLIGFGGKCLWEGNRLNHDFERWQAAVTVDGPIDFSEPGQFVMNFDQTYVSPHGGDFVSLQVPQTVLQQTTVTQLLTGIKAIFTIVDKSESNSVTSADFYIWKEDATNGVIPIFRIPSFRKGSYQAIVTVIEGGPALKGVNQTLQGRYELCGLERMVAMILFVIGGASAGLGILVGLVVYSRLARDRKKIQGALAQPLQG